MAVKRSSRLRAAWLATGLAACTAQPAVPHRHPLPDVTLRGTDARNHRIESELVRARFTVFVFFSKDCAIQRAHDARLSQIAERYRDRGVRVLAIDSETGTSLARDAAEVRARGYRFPILLDADGRFARALGARYSTYSVIADARGRVRYAGAIDTDRQRLHAEATPYLDNALGALLRGAEPEPAETESLGCFLRLW